MHLAIAIVTPPKALLHEIIAREERINTTPLEERQDEAREPCGRVRGKGVVC